MKGNITITRVKKYNASWNRVVCVNGTLVAITKSSNRANEIVKYIMGIEADVNDGTLRKQSLDHWKGSK